MSARITVWVDDMDDLAEFVDQLPDGTVPTLGRDEEGWYVSVDLTSAEDVEAQPGIPPAVTRVLDDFFGPESTPDPQPAEVVDEPDDHDGHTIVVGVPDHVGEPLPKSAAAADAPLTCEAAVLAVFQAEPDVALGLSDVFDAVEGGYKQSTVTFTVRELTNSGRIQRVGRGLYQAVR